MCEIHWNFKLLFSAIPGNLSLKEYLMEMVSDIENRSCVLWQCDECPSQEKTEKNLSNIFNENNMDDDEISYKQ